MNGIPTCPICAGSILADLSCLMCNRSFKAAADGALAEIEPRPAVTPRPERRGKLCDSLKKPAVAPIIEDRRVPISTAMARAAKWGAWE